MEKHEQITQAAISNYSSSTPWPEHDIWHDFTFKAEKQIVEQWLSQYSSQSAVVLNAGSGGTEYRTNGKIVHLDIIEKYIQRFEHYLVGSIEKIDLPDMSVDGVICVGSVLNYADAQRSISEFYRILKPDGFLILEFERSDSAEFLWTERHGKYIFSKEYTYNGQSHLLWMYSEKHIRQLLKHYGFQIKKCKRIHSVSSLLYRFGVSEKVAAAYSTLDSVFSFLSYPTAHNAMLLCTKQVLSKRNN